MSVNFEAFFHNLNFCVFLTERTNKTSTSCISTVFDLVWADWSMWVASWGIPTLAGGLVCNYYKQEMDCGYLASGQAKHKPFSQNTTFAPFCVTEIHSCCVFHSFSPHMSLCLPSVKSCWSAEVISALTGNTCGLKAWPEWRGPSFLRMDYSEACSNQRGRGTTKTSSAPPPSTCPPQPCPFPHSHACFQEDQASCVMEWWKRGGRGGWDREEKTDMERDG